MTLNELIANLQQLQREGHGEEQVFATHGASGACDPVGSAHPTESDGNEMGEPSEWEVGTRYIDLYIGN